MSILNLITLLFGGLLAGIEIAVHYGFRASAGALDERAQLVLRQAMVRRLRIFVPAFFLPAALSGTAVIAIGGAPGFIIRCAGLLALLMWVLVRIVGTVPINSATLTWDIDAPPKDWKARVDYAERFHIIGVWGTVASFACFLIAALF